MLSKLINSYVDKTEPQASEANIKAEVERRYQDIGTQAAKRYTRGNVNIQDGEFLMKEELEADIQRKIKR